MKDSLTKHRGQSLVDILLAVVIFSIGATGFVLVLSESFTTARVASETIQANSLIVEAVEATKSIRDESFHNLVDGTYGLDDTSGLWEFSGSSDVIGKYTREVTISGIERDGNGDIVESGGTLDNRTKKITVDITWEISPTRTGEAQFVTFITDINIRDWIQTTDTDFNAGSHSNTTVIGSGEAAGVTLAQDTADLELRWTVTSGNSVTHTNETDFGTGTLTDTEVIDTGTPASVQLATEIEWRDHAVPGANDMDGVYMISATEGWSVGKGGEIWKWDGTTWSSVTSPVNKDLSDVYFASPNDGWAVGAMGTIIHYDGVSWSTFTSPVNKGLNDIDGISGSDILAVGDTGTIIHYDGVSWSTQASPFGQAINGLDMLSATEAWAGGNNGNILEYNGSTWSSVPSPVSEKLNGFFMISPTEGWGVGNAGTIIEWDGVSWTNAASPTSNNIEGIHGSSGTNIYAVGHPKLILHYDGVSWTVVEDAGTGGALKSVYIYDEENIFSTGDGGLMRVKDEHYFETGTIESSIIDSGTAGESWDSFWWSEDLPTDTDITLATRTGETATPDGSWSAWSGEYTNYIGEDNSSPNGRYLQYRATLSTNDLDTTPIFEDVTLNYNAPTTQDLQSIFFADDSTGWAVGNGGTIISYDGSSWSLDSSPTSDTLHGLYAISATDVWAVGANGSIIHYNGSVWTGVSSPTSNTLYGVFGLSDTDVWAVGAGGVIIHYDGVSWTSQTSPTSDDLQDISGTSATDLWATATSRTVLHYDGATWSDTMGGGQLNTYYSIDAVDTTNVWTGGDSGNIEKWTGSWGFQSTGTTDGLYGIDMVDSSTGFSVGQNGTILQYNGTWSGMVSPVSSTLNDVFALTDVSVWAVGVSGKLIKYSAIGDTIFHSSGTYNSPVFDSGDTGTVWDFLYWTETLGASTDISLQTRTGNTASPDGSWSAWSGTQTDPAGEDITSPDAQYFQYQVNFSTSNPENRPQLEDTTVSYD